MPNPVGVLSPAYGREYKNKAEVLAAWEGGKDFILNSFAGSILCSRADFPDPGTIQIRYGKKNTKVLVAKTR